MDDDHVAGPVAVVDLAWVSTEARLTAPGAKPTDIVSTETMILRIEPAGWRIVHIHWSSRQASHQ
ncbi:MAG: nuclear transport factor 2 family protein [Steroidobacterales bacterium]